MKLQIFRIINNNYSSNSYVFNNIFDNHLFPQNTKPILVASRNDFKYFHLAEIYDTFIANNRPITLKNHTRTSLHLRHSTRYIYIQLILNMECGTWHVKCMYATPKQLLQVYSWIYVLTLRRDNCYRFVLHLFM